MKTFRDFVDPVRWQEATPAASPTPNEERKPTEPAENERQTLQGRSHRRGAPPLRFVQAHYWKVPDGWTASCPVCHIGRHVKPGDEHECCGEKFVPVEVLAI